MGAERPRGFLTFFARFDPAQILSMCSQMGTSVEDERVAGFLEFVTSKQGAYGLWEYSSRPQVSRWVTFDILRSMAQLQENEGCPDQEPRTPYQSHPRREKWF